MIPTLWFLILSHTYFCYAQQFYDPTLCDSHTNNPGTRYACNSFQKSCQTFLVYRANQGFQTIFNISSLFNVISHDELLSLNNLTSSTQILEPGTDVLVPIKCSCTGQFFQANLSYYVAYNTTFANVACGVYEGLVKSSILVEENEFQGNVLNIGSVLNVPLKCACPDNVSSVAGYKYFVTYPLVEGDYTNKVAQKFDIAGEDIWEANHIDSLVTVYPNTTILVPLRSEPRIRFISPDSQPPTPGFLPISPIERTKSIKLKKLYIAGSVIGFSLVLLTLLGCGIYVKALRRWKGEKFHHSSARRSSMTSFSTPLSSPLSVMTPRSSTNSCLSPDLLIGLKYTLCSYSTEEIREATNDFTEETKINGYLYKGFIDDAEVMIKQMRFEDIRQVIDLHSKMNHVNIMKLLGVCYGESDFSWSYLVFELPKNGSLRDCLSKPLKSLKWIKRTHIAYDLAKALHYLHYCMVPPHTHMSINSTNIFLTPSWRAKLAVSGSTPSVGCSKENEIMSSAGGWIAPEHLLNGLVNEKVDIFAFGVVLLELMSARESVEGRSFRESIGFLGGGASEGGCFEQLRSFMDPSLKEDYPLAEALCLAVLAKACVEDDPMHRPSMDDIIKVLARMV
ncbi:hypothetical protein DCAR_0623287 [Daucus carota subsp. sativus]|uniref:Protein kinase domain-containing protein n=1 Tax=Daucus carota subsp. sativus TaxID=79200 RepID=A0A161ZTC9_DAUCS|nr:hypothetical protein DCAR_0623287 [Daucus carota subsp. sativus]